MVMCAFNIAHVLFVVYSSRIDMNEYLSQMDHLFKMVHTLCVLMKQDE